MPVRLAITEPEALEAAIGVVEEQRVKLRPSVTVATAAHDLSCDESTVRALLRAGDLEGHRIGKGLCRKKSGKKVEPRGVRVFIDSIAAYQRRHATGDPASADAGEDDDAPPTPAPRRRRALTGPQAEAIAFLQRRGVIPQAGRR